MSDTFKRCLSIVLEFEGGLSDDKNDRGGLTNFGILNSEYSAWRKKQGLEPRSVEFISPDEVAQIYLTEYWGPSKADQFAWPLNLVSFDGAVNCGPRQQALWLQRALGVDADGLIGPKTLIAAKDADPVGISKAILEQRADFYRGLVRKDPKQSDFIDGWMNRVITLRGFASHA